MSLLFAETYPLRTEKLILVAPAFIKGLPQGVMSEKIARRAKPQNEDEMRGYLQRIFCKTPTNKNYIQKIMAEINTKNKGEAILSVAKSLAAGQDLLDNQRLKDLNLEILIIHGNCDGVVPVAASKSLVSLLPNATFQLIEDAGHWSQYEKPAIFNLLLSQFMNQG